ncbi:ferredoxin-type protein NapF [Vibrio ishigakensis]|uniref:ferredoxin-type protein NapF n=1 Tax=Vibrio ishigakensis TaxID=1481914 RepID=UPI0021C3D3ED|nr:ferredoxin-type protein NapF [Vibrio ishigakensis]
MVDLSRRRLFTRRSQQNQLIYQVGTRLPWAKEDALFIDGCTQCGKCIDACETKIIVKGSGGYPSIDFEKGECTFCEGCASVCPEPIFRATDEAPWEIKATIKESCLALQNVECRTCSDVCEPFAIQFSLQIGRVAQPKLDSNLCTGCGACVSACPATAISMTDNKEGTNAGQ